MNNNYHFQVNLGGMLDILSNHLYKTPDVFLRELMQNGVDAVTLRQKREPFWNEGRIVIHVQKGKRLFFQDNGAGLTQDEIHRFLAVIGQSSKSELVDGRIPTDFIGRFGIGLLSCFMVSDSIEVHTKSMTDKQAYVWKGYADGTYTLEELDDCNVGTTIILTAKRGSEFYYEPNKIKELVRYYGLTLPVPIYLNDRSAEEEASPSKETPISPDNSPLNYTPEDFSHLNAEQLLSLGEWLFGEEFLAAIPIQTPHLSGAAYIVGYQTDISVKKSHRIHLKNMLLTEEAVPLLPDWAFFLRCFLNTDTLRPTASRENFYEDEELALAQQEFSGAVQQYFERLAVRKPDKLRQIVSLHHTAMKSMAVWNDELFRLLIDYLPFTTSEGEMTGAALKKAGQAVIINDLAKFKQLKPIFVAQEKLLICTAYSFDDQLMQKLTDYFQLPITPIQEENMELVLEEIGFEEKQAAFSMLHEMNKGLQEFDCQAELKRFYPMDLPALYYMSDDVAFLRQVQNASEGSQGIFSETLTSLLRGVEEKPLATLYLNGNSPLIRRLLQINDSKKLQSVAKILYVHAMVTGGHTLHRRELQMLGTELLYLIDEKEGE